ncbi:MAG TPA: MFS transporter, partial [Elusimicrobiales bacterium]|nr:MFS transporter [Elusimicrobiales bacterium]
MSDTAEKKEELSIIDTFKILFGASKGFWLVNMVNFGDGIAYFGVLTLLTRFLGTRLGMPDHTTTVSVSMFTGMVTLFMFGCGFIADKLGVRRALTLALGMLLAGRFLLVLSPAAGAAWPVAWASLLIMAFGSGVLQPALYAGAKEYTDDRTATIGYSLIYSIMNLGIVAENFISPYVRTSDTFLTLGGKPIAGLGLGIDGVYLLCVLITVLMLVAHLLFFTKKVEHDCCVTKATAEPEDPEHKKSFKEKMLELPFMDARFMFFIFILLPVQTLFAHQFLTIPDYVFRDYSQAVSNKFEWISGLNPLIIVIFVPLIAAFTRKANIVTMMIIGTTISALTTFLLVPGPGLGRLLAYVIIFSLGEAVWSSRFYEYVADLAPAGKVGAYMGLAGIPWFMAKFTTGLYAGKMLEIYIPKEGLHNSGQLWLIYALIACISPVGLILA